MLDENLFIVNSSNLNQSLAYRNLMKTMRTYPTTIILLFLALIRFNAFGETLAVGDAFPVIDAQDQHEEPYKVEADTKYVIISFDMTPGKKANAYLEEKGKDYLAENNAVFIANIFGMPGIGRFFAIPKMQKYPHRILLADEKGLLDDFPMEKGKVTVLTRDAAGKIEAIKFWDPKDGSSPF